MSDETYWVEAKRLAEECELADNELIHYLAKTPAPRSAEELADYDELHNAALTAHHYYSLYCLENRHRR